MQIVVSITDLGKQVICSISEPNNVSAKFCGLSHSADTKTLSDRVPTSHKQLGSVS